MAKLIEIVVDAANPSALASFWAAALDGYAVREYTIAEVARLAELGLTPETDPNVAVDGPGPTLFFQLCRNPRDAVNVPRQGRLHLDLVAVDRQSEVQRLLGLGAALSDPDDHRRNYSVMLDPEGNAFCVQQTFAAKELT